MRLFQVGEAARRLECSAGWIRYLADTGRLPCRRTTTGVRVFKEEDLKQFARKRQQRGLRTARPTKRAAVRRVAPPAAELPGCLNPHSGREGMPARCIVNMAAPTPSASAPTAPRAL